MPACRAAHARGAPQSGRQGVSRGALLQMANTTKGSLVSAPLSRDAPARTQEPSPTLSVVPTPAAAMECSESEILSTQQFFRQLRIEKRRADRTNSPLSLVLVRVNSDQGGGFAVVEDLLELLSRNKRETDILGYIAKDRIALLLPHTDEHGVRAFVNGVEWRTAKYPVSISSCTYPHHLFESLMSDTREMPDTLMFLFDERTKESAFDAFAKRVVDVVGALIALVLLSPLMLGTALAVALTSPGPIIFRQVRLGKGGVPFVFYKFRSMYANADDRIHREYVANLIEGKLEEINQGDSERPLYKMNADPRITKVGRIIRRTSLDELPQLFNVLKGDMSLVGPRPPLPYEAEKYQSWHLRRVLEVRPGITGLWQVEGRSTTSFDDMVRLDLRYIRQRCLWLDLKILLKTIKVVLRRDGAS